MFSMAIKMFISWIPNAYLANVATDVLSVPYDVLSSMGL